MSITEELWDFPMEYMLKTIGHSHAPLADIDSEIVRRYVPNFDARTVTLKPSGKGNYTSVTATLVFENKSQVEGVYRDLNAHEAIVWSL
ncbi:MAG: DUF493 domain-containing protein [Gammaproteobacteria bacterium]